MVALRAVVLRPAAVPVAGVRRPGPAEAEGLPRPAPRSPRRRSSRTEADVRISGVPVGKVKTIEPDNADGPLGRRRSSSTPSYAPLPSDARAILRQKTLLGETYVELTPGTRAAPPIPEGGALPPRRCPTRSSSTRSCARSTPRRARRSRPGCRRRRRRSTAAGRTSTTRSATSPRSPRTRRDDRSTILNRQEGARRALIANTGDGLRRAVRARRPAARADRRTRTRCSRRRRRATQQLQAAFVALPTFERESARRSSASTQFAARHRPARSRSCARRRASCRPTLERPADARARPRARCFRELEPLITRRRRASRRPSRSSRTCAPLLGQLDPALRQLNPIARLHRPLQARADRVLRQHGRRDAGASDRRRPSVHYLRTTNPLNPENLAVYPQRLADEPAEPVPLPGALRPAAAGLLAVYETRQCGAARIPTDRRRRSCAVNAGRSPSRSSPR